MREPKQPEQTRQPWRITVPSRADGFLRLFTRAIGGPLGRHSDPGRVTPGLFTVERVLMIFTTFSAFLMLLAKNPCRINGWGGSNPYLMACYTDWVPLFGARGFADNPWAPFSAGAEFEYPVLMSAAASAVAALVPEGGTNRGLLFFDLNLILVAILWFVIVWATMRMAGRRPWDAALVALAPGIVLTASINWDMWAVAMLALGMLSFARGRLVLAGVLIGLGTAMKLYPVLILGAILVLALRTGRLKAFFVTAGSAVAAWLAVNLPYAIAFPDSFAHFFKFTSDRGAGLSSFWHVWNIISREVSWLPSADADAISRLGLIIFFFACVAVALLTFFAPQRPRLASLTFLIVASFVMVNKVYSPQFVIWLIPLFALALPRWREFVMWMAVEVLHFYGLWFYIHSYTSDVEANHAFPESGYVLLVLGHMVMLGYLMYRVIQSILKPEYDPVRAVGQEDPQAGPFAGAEDRLSWKILQQRREKERV